MPLYLVRWPGLVAALVTAVDENDLLDVLDEIANPEGCTWVEYDGPIFIEFKLNAEFRIEESDGPQVRPLEPKQIQIVDVSRIQERDVMTAVIPGSEMADDMVEAITSEVFPTLHLVLEEERGEIPQDVVRDAIRVELDTLLRASWQQEQTKRRTDPASKVAARMATSPKLVAHWSQRAAAADTAASRPPPTTPKRPKASRAKRTTKSRSTGGRKKGGRNPRS